MNYITCYIVDDEYHAIEILKEFVLKTPYLTLVGCSDDPVMALNEIQTMQPDLIFLDVDMPEISGLDFADMIGLTSLIVFTTSHSKYAVPAFDKQVFDFLMKPITYERFMKCIHKVRKDFIQKRVEYKGVKQYFYIKTDLKGKLDKIDLEDILYIKAEGNYVQLHLRVRNQMAYLQMGEVEDYLPSGDFSRIHKSYIINDAAIKTLEPGQVTLKNDEILFIGRTYQEKFHEKMSHLIFKSKRDT